MAVLACAHAPAAPPRAGSALDALLAGRRVAAWQRFRPPARAGSRTTASRSEGSGVLIVRPRPHITSRYTAMYGNARQLPYTRPLSVSGEAVDAAARPAWARDRAADL